MAYIHLIRVRLLYPVLSAGESITHGGINDAASGQPAVRNAHISVVEYVDTAFVQRLHGSIGSIPYRTREKAGQNCGVKILTRDIVPIAQWIKATRDLGSNPSRNFHLKNIKIYYIIYLSNEEKE